MFQTLTVRTGSRTEFLDLTRQIQAAVQESGVREGLCHLSVPHTTAGITINENADPDVQSDIWMVLNRLVSDQESYRHSEGNSPGHIKSSLFGSQLTLIIHDGRLVLGTWQGIYFCEFDGPRSRRLHLKVVAD